MELINDLFRLENEDKALTFREIEYLSLIALGFKNDKIATTLCVTKSTVKKTLENIFRDLKAKDRANAVAIAFIHKIITPKSLAGIVKRYKLYDI